MKWLIVVWEVLENKIPEASQHNEGMDTATREDYQASGILFLREFLYIGVFNGKISAGLKRCELLKPSVSMVARCACAHPIKVNPVIGVTTKPPA